MSRGINNHRRAKSNNDFKQLLGNKITHVEENQLITTQKAQSFGNMLFQIPEQTDIASSTEQTMNSAKKNQNNSNKKNHSQDQKENLKYQNSCSSLISQIQYMVKGGHPIKEITQKALNSERHENHKQLSFTNELQKKHSHNQLTPHSNHTPDKIEYSSKQKKDDGKYKIELSNSLLSSLLKVDPKRKSVFDKQESFRKMEMQMNKIQKDIHTIKQRQDQLDEFNRNMQTQLCSFMSENQKQQDYGQQSLKKLEQLEQITRRNEESIKQLRDTLILNQPYKGNENVVNFGYYDNLLSNLSLFKHENDRHSKFSDLKSYNKY